MENKPRPDTFRRVEDKYALTPEQAEQFLEKIQSYVHPDAWFRYTVHSIYYDSENSDLVIAGMEKPEYKVKLRLRGYGTVKPQDTVFLETKKKYSNIVYKKRFPLTSEAAIGYMEYGIPHGAKGNTAGEIDYMMNRWNLQAKVMISYDRECYSACSEQDVRITFDRNIRYRLDDLDDLNDNGTERLLNEGAVMLEVKAMDRYPLWLVQILSEMKIRQTSFSKYARIYRDNFTQMSVTGNLRVTPERNRIFEEVKLCSLPY